MKYTITYALTGGMEIEAASEDEALSKFDKISSTDLYENAGDTDTTGIFAEEQKGKHYENYTRR